jgi:hypothetical protein
MKTCSLYGFISALAGAFLVLILYFTGLHSDPAKLTAAKWVGGLGGLAIGVTVTALGIKARREEVPATEGFGYGSALWAGVLITFVSSVLSGLFTYCYHSFINPGFSDILLQDSISKLEARGLSGAQLDKMESLNRVLFSPVWEALLALIFGFIFGFIICLIVAAFLTRPAPPKLQTLA